MSSMYIKCQAFRGWIWGIAWHVLIHPEWALHPHYSVVATSLRMVCVLLSHNAWSILKLI